LDGDGVNDLAVGAVADANSGAVHILYMVGISPANAPPTTSGGGGGKSNCDSNGFGNNNSLRVYQVMYDVETNEVQVYAYSTCGSGSSKMTTPMQQSVLGLFLEQTLLDDDIAIQNKRYSFDETFYIHDKSIIKKYTGETGYTSEQQGTTLPPIVSQ
jgi:hypothetical protein